MDHEIFGSPRKYVLPALHAGPSGIIPYPGGKHAIAADIMKMVPRDVDAIAIPFCGGGSLLIAAAEEFADSQCRLIASEPCPALCSLFVALQKHGRSVAEYLRGIKEHYGYVDRELFGRCLTVMRTSDDLIERAVATYIYFRSVWVTAARFFRPSGFSESRGRSALSDQLIRRLPVIGENLRRVEFHAESYDVTFGRVRRYGDRALIIADPPYLGRDWSVYNCGFCQERLADDIRSISSQFIMTLDTSHESLSRYAAFARIYYRMNYSSTEPSSGRRKIGVEQLIYRGNISVESVMHMSRRWSSDFVRFDRRTSAVNDNDALLE